MGKKLSNDLLMNKPKAIPLPFDLDAKYPTKFTRLQTNLYVSFFFF